MLRPLLCIATLMLAAFFTPHPAAAGSIGPLDASGESHGIRISISLPRRAYPMDALVVATITVTNVGHQDRFLPDWPPNWGGSFSPHVRMRTPSGRLIYQEELSTFVTPTPGSYPTPYILHPGYSLTRHVRFVLEAPQVQAVDRVANGYISFSSSRGTPTLPRSMLATSVWHVTSPFITIRLTREQPPSVRVFRKGGSVIATFSSTPGATGRAFYMDSTYCTTGSGGWTDQHVPWTVASTNRIGIPLYPYCAKRQWWHAVIGWPNHAVAFVRYTASR